MTRDALSTLADYVAQAPLQAEAKTIGFLRDGVIDGLGCMIAGARSDVARKGRAAVRSMGAQGPAGVIGADLQVPAPQAAFLNAIAGHALDFDDWEMPGNTHPSVVLAPALLAMSRQDTTGADFAQAYLAGFEVIARLGEGLNFAHYDAGWHSTATLGAVGAAAGCARLVGLDQGQTAHAMALACSSAGGFTCQFGSDAKPVQAGFAARAGVEAACLAGAGMTAQTHVLDHPRGFAALMGGLDPGRLARALGKLGTGLALAEHGLVLKPWPSCGYTHRIMTCALSLKDRLPLPEMSRIEIHMPDFHASVLPFAQPRSRAEALFSAPYVAVMGLARGGLTLSDLDAETWNAPEVVGLIAKCQIVPFAPRRPDLNYSDEDPDRLIVTLTSGAQVEARCVHPLGAPHAPMTSDQVMAKFQSNLGPLAERANQIDPGFEHLRAWPSAPSILDALFQEGLSR